MLRICHLPLGGRQKLVHLDRAINDRPYFSSCGAGYHRGAISSTAGGYHLSARESLADRISLRGRPSPRPGEASKKSTSERGRNSSLYCSNGTRKLPPAAQKKEARCSHFLLRVAILFVGSFWGVWGTFFKKSPTKTPRPNPASLTRVLIPQRRSAERGARGRGRRGGRRRGERERRQVRLPRERQEGH